MIRAGVFALTGFAAGLAGPSLTLAFLLNGLVAMFTAGRTPNSAGPSPRREGVSLGEGSTGRPQRFYAEWVS